MSLGDVDTGWWLGRRVVPPITKLIAPAAAYGVDRIPPEGGAVIAANHFSAIDHPLIGAFVPGITYFLAKSELFEIPVLGEALAWMGVISIRRGESDRDALRVAREHVRNGDVVCVHIEGTRQRLGYPGPHTVEADATKRMGSMVPSADIASLTQLRTDGSSRDVIQLSPGRDIHVGRERGDWIFPYDPSMSAQHATVRSEDADFVLVDDHSRNGVAIAARGAMPLQHGSRIMVGDKLLRVELPAAAPIPA